MASHWALQYLPEVVMHVQTGCAHFVAFVAAIVSSSGFGSIHSTSVVYQCPVQDAS
jgi:hypothetical protein